MGTIDVNYTHSVYRLYTLCVQTVHNMCTKNIIILKRKEKKNFSLREKGGRASLGQKNFSTEFLRIYLVWVNNTTYIVDTKLSIQYMVA